MAVRTIDQNLVRKLLLKNLDSGKIPKKVSEDISNCCLISSFKPLILRRILLAGVFSLILISKASSLFKAFEKSLWLPYPP